MKRHTGALRVAAGLMLSLTALSFAATASAQNVVITNARIIDGTGKVIERGSLVAKDGRIVSVSASAAPAAERGAVRIDAKGMTVMPGFIDAHRHIIRGPAQQWLSEQAAASMKGFLDAGFTTVFSMGDDPQGMIELRRRVNAGELAGPRLFAARMLPVAKGFPPSPVPPAPSQYRDPGRTDPAREPRPFQPAEGISDEDARAAVQQAKQQGFDAIKTVLVVVPGGPESHTLSVMVDEAHKQGLRMYTHATNYIDTLAAVNSKVDVLAHTPHIGQLEENVPARDYIAKAKIPMVSTLQVFGPHFDETNQPLYRDGGPFPMPRPLSSAGQGPVNARLLWDAGTVYGYGTDTTWDPRVSLGDELRMLSLVFSPRDIVKIMGPNTAAVIDKSADLGTLEPGKLADIVLIDGDPLQDINSLTRVRMTLKEGKVVSDQRTQR